MSRASYRALVSSVSGYLSGQALLDRLAAHAVAKTPYELRPSVRQHSKLVGSTYLDQDTSGTFVGPGEKPRTPSSSPSRPAREPRSVSEPGSPKSFSEQLARQTGKKHILIFSPKSELVKAKMAAIGSDENNWPYENNIPLLYPDPPNDFNLLTLETSSHGLRKRSAGGSCGDMSVESNVTTSPASTGEMTADGRPYPTIGHPAARGCKNCFELSIECTMLDDEPNYPCAHCEEDDEACELFIQPKWKATCQGCKKARVACSYNSTEEEEEHAAPCMMCVNDARVCCAGPRKGGARLKRNSSVCRKTVDTAKSGDVGGNSRVAQGQDIEVTTKQTEPVKQLDTTEAVEGSETIDKSDEHDKTDAIGNVGNEDKDPLANMAGDASDSFTNLINEANHTIFEHEDSTTCNDTFLQAIGALHNLSGDTDDDVLGVKADGAPVDSYEKEEGLNMPIDTHSGKINSVLANPSEEELEEEDEEDEKEEQEVLGRKDVNTQLPNISGDAMLPVQTYGIPVAPTFPISQSSSSEKSAANAAQIFNQETSNIEEKEQKAQSLRELIIAENVKHFGNPVSSKAVAVLQSVTPGAITGAIIAEKKGNGVGKFKKINVEQEEDARKTNGDVTPPKKRKRQGDDTAGPSKKTTPAMGGKQATKAKRMDKITAMKGASQDSPPPSATESVFPTPPTTVTSKSSDDDVEKSLSGAFAAESEKTANIWNLASRIAGDTSPSTSNLSVNEQHLPPGFNHGNITVPGKSVKQLLAKSPLKAKAYKTPSIIDEAEDDEDVSINDDVRGPSRLLNHFTSRPCQHPKATAIRRPLRCDPSIDSQAFDLTTSPTRHHVRNQYDDHQSYPRGAATSSPALTFLSEEVERKQRALWLAHRRERRLQQEIQDAVAAMRGRSTRGTRETRRSGTRLTSNGFGFSQGETIDLTDDTIEMNIGAAGGNGDRAGSGRKKKKGYTEIIELDDDSGDNAEDDDDDDDAAEAAAEKALEMIRSKKRMRMMAAHGQHGQRIDITRM